MAAAATALNAPGWMVPALFAQTAAPAGTGRTGTASGTGGTGSASAAPALSGETTGPGALTQAIATAQQSLAKADALVATDQANHSPGCVAIDQKQVDRASLQLAQAKAQALAAGVNVLV